jgi:hypothetical protein
MSIMINILDLIGARRTGRGRGRKKENELTIHIIGYVNTLYSPVKKMSYYYINTSNNTNFR